MYAGSIVIFGNAAHRLRNGRDRSRRPRRPARAGPRLPAPARTDGKNEFRIFVRQLVGNDRQKTVAAVADKTFII